MKTFHTLTLHFERTPSGSPLYYGGTTTARAAVLPPPPPRTNQDDGLRICSKNLQVINFHNVSECRASAFYAKSQAYRSGKCNYCFKTLKIAGAHSGPCNWCWNLRMACGWESSLEVAGTLVAATPSPGSILQHMGVAGWSWGRYCCHKDPVRLNSNCAKFCTWVVFNYSPSFQFINPGRGRPSSEFPICKPCLGVRQNPKYQKTLKILDITRSIMNSVFIFGWCLRIFQVESWFIMKQPLAWNNSCKIYIWIQWNLHLRCFKPKWPLMSYWEGDLVINRILIIFQSGFTKWVLQLTLGIAI